MIFGVYSGDFSIVDALIVSLVAILIVFSVLTIVIGVCSAVQKGTDKIEKTTHICPKEENKILETDEDAVAAALVATIDFYKETGENARLVKIEKVEE